MITINMLSKAHKVQGQGVLSAHNEQVNLVKEMLADSVEVYENAPKLCDIMHYHTINPEYFLTLPMAKAHGTTVGYVHFLPETLENSVHLLPVCRDVFYWYVIQFYKSMDYLVTVNPCFIDKLAAYGIDRNKVTYIPNFVCDKQFFPMDDAGKQAMRKKYDIPQDKFVVFCAGQLQKRKGTLDFVEIARKMPDIEFVWAGNFAFGKISDGYREIQNVLENPPANVRFLGLVPREDMNGLYNAADVMFLPSYEELFPMTVLESMNCAVPILLRDLELYEDILFDFYLRGHDNQDFCEQLRQLKSDPAFYRQASELSHQGHALYSRDSVAGMWRTFYEEAAARTVRPYRERMGLSPQLMMAKPKHMIKKA